MKPPYHKQVVFSILVQNGVPTLAAGRAIPPMRRRAGRIAGACTGPRSPPGLPLRCQ